MTWRAALVLLALWVVVDSCSAHIVRDHYDAHAQLFRNQSDPDTPSVPLFTPDGDQGGTFSGWQDFVQGFARLPCPEIPSSWSTPLLGYYAINEATGNDSGNTYGTPASPRATMPLTGPGPGSLVVYYGNYSHTHDGFGVTGLAWQGSAQSPACLTKGSSTSAITGQFDFKGAGYVIAHRALWDSALSGPCQLQIIGLSHHIVIRNSELTGTTAGGGWCAFGSDVSNQVSYFQMIDTSVHDVGEWDNTTDDNDIHGGKIGRWVNYAWVTRGQHHHLGGDAVQVEAGSGNQADTRYIFLTGMTMHHNRQTCLWMKYATDVVMASNLCYELDTYTVANSSMPPCYGGQYQNMRLWIVGNLCASAGDCIRISSQDSSGLGTAIYIVGNLCADGDPASGSLSDNCDHSAFALWGGDAILVAWNTVYNWPQGYCEPDFHNYGTRNIHNNLFDTIDTGNGGYHIKIMGSTAAATVSSSNVNGIVSTSPFKQYLEGVGGNPFTVNAPFSDANIKVVADVMMSNPAGGSFGLQSGSPALDFNPTDLSGISSEYFTRYGERLTTDYLEKNRTNNGTTDVGFLERQQ